MVKIDDKIVALVEWSKKYPKAKANGSVCPEHVVREYAPTEPERRKFEEQYKQIQRYYEYVRVRNTESRDKKLTANQIQMCKEGNVRGVFGYPTETEELARKYRRDPSTIDDILCEFGSMEEFINNARKHSPTNSIFNCFIDVSGQTQSSGIDNLLQQIGWNHEGIVLIDKEQFLRKIQTLKGPKPNIIMHKYGINTPKLNTFAEIGEELEAEIGRERLRQLYNIAIQELRRYLWKEGNHAVIYAESYDQEDEMTPELRERRQQLLGEIYASNHVIIPDEKFKTEPATIPAQRLKEIAEELKDIHIQHRNPQGIEHQEQTVTATPIEELGLSPRAYHVLVGAGIRTIEDLKPRTPRELIKLKAAGEKTIKEIEGQLAGIGIKLAEPKKTIEKSEKNKLKAIGLSTRAVNALYSANIRSVGQLCVMTPEEIQEIRGIGKKTRDEIMQKQIELSSQSPLQPQTPLERAMQIKAAEEAQEAGKKADMVAVAELYKQYAKAAGINLSQDGNRGENG